MRVRIGPWEQVAQGTLHVPESNDALIEFLVKDALLRFTIRFAEDKENPLPRFEIEGGSNEATIAFKNFNSKLPAGIENFFVLGDVGEQKLSMLFSGYSVGKMRHLEITFYAGNP